MILTGQEIKKRIGRDIIIDPFNESQLNPNSYNVRLSNHLIEYVNEVINSKEKNEYRDIYIGKEGYTLDPYKLYLGQTTEYTETYNLVPMIEGRSSLGRLGVFVHITAGFGDIGFKGFWTFEIMCLKPTIIYPDLEIAQLYYHIPLGEIKKYKSNKYQENIGIQPSLLYKDFKDKR